MIGPLIFGYCLFVFSLPGLAVQLMHYLDKKEKRSKEGGKDG